MEVSLLPDTQKIGLEILEKVPGCWDGSHAIQPTTCIFMSHDEACK